MRSAFRFSFICSFHEKATNLGNLQLALGVEEMVKCSEWAVCCELHVLE